MAQPDCPSAVAPRPKWPFPSWPKSLPFVTAFGEAMIVGLLLAAGRSTRFGSNKLLHAPSGEPPLALQAARCLSGLEYSLAVIPEGDAMLRTLFRGFGLAVVEVTGAEPMNADLPPGLSDSLRAGLKATPDAAAWIIALSDMPQVKPGTVAAIRQALFEGA